jgi:hypothetical protein
VLGHCDGAVDRTLLTRNLAQITTGKCYNTNSVSKGAMLINPNQVCVMKFYEGKDCSGSAGTWYVPQSVSSKCIPTTKQGGQSVLSGVGSYLANCAQDTVPVF